MRLAYGSGIVVIILAAVLVFWYWNTSRPVGGVLSLVTHDYVDDGRDWVAIRRMSGTYEINARTGELRPYTDPAETVRTFSGLPPKGTDKNAVTYIQPYIVSQDKSQSLVAAVTYDETKPPSGFDGSYPMIDAQEFLCNMAAKTCKPSTILEDAFQATKEQGSWYRYSIVRWIAWDSERNFLYGHRSGEGVGNASPVYAFDASDSSLRKTDGYGSLDMKEKRAEVPAGAFSPLLDRVVMVEESGQEWSLLLYKTDDLSVPLKTYDVSLMNDTAYGRGRISSVAWSLDEKFLVLETNRQIFLLNTATGGITLIYTDTTQHESGLWLDFNAVALSPSERYIMFVDYKQGASGDHTLHTVLKAIDLADTDKVLEVLREDGLMLSDER